MVRPLSVPGESGLWPVKDPCTVAHATQKTIYNFSVAGFTYISAALAALRSYVQIGDRVPGLLAKDTKIFLFRNDFAQQKYKLHPYSPSINLLLLGSVCC